MIQNARLANDEFLHTRFHDLCHCYIAMVFVIIKLNKLEKDRLLAMDADRQIKGDKNV